MFIDMSQENKIKPDNNIMGKDRNKLSIETEAKNCNIGYHGRVPITISCVVFFEEEFLEHPALTHPVLQKHWEA